MSHKKFGPDQFSRFDVYWIQTNKQTNRQAKFIDRRHFDIARLQLLHKTFHTMSWVDCKLGIARLNGTTEYIYTIQPERIIQIRVLR